MERLGVYPDITAEEYHKIPAVSNSYLSKLGRFPAEAKLPSEDTASFLFGRAFHCLLLEGKAIFDSLFVTAPDVDRRTAAGKALYAEFLTTSHGKGVIPKCDYDSMVDMVNSIIRHPFAVQILCGGRSEQSVFWVDEDTGLYCKCRPDRIPDGDHGVVLDVKTTKDATQSGFSRAIANYGYHRQAAFYLDGFNAISNVKVDAFIFIAVEKEPPYAVGCFLLNDVDISVGRMRYKGLMEKEKQCRANDLWPNYESEALIEVNLPMWA